MGEKISLREFAKRVGVTAPAVLKAINYGRIGRGADMKIDWETEGPKWGNRDVSKIRQNSFVKGPEQNKPGLAENESRPAPVRKPVQNEQAPAEKPETPEEFPETQNAPTIVSNYNKAKTVKETYNAKLKQLEFEKASGRLVDKDDVKIALYNFCRVIRDKILDIPDRVASKVASELLHYIKSEFSKSLEPAKVDELIAGLELQAVGKIVGDNWDLESRNVLEELQHGPEV